MRTACCCLRLAATLIAQQWTMLVFDGCLIPARFRQTPMLKAVLATGCLVGLALPEANSAELSGQDIRDLFAGATVNIQTPLGSKLPVHYGPHGQLSGQAGPLAL